MAFLSLQHAVRCSFKNSQLGPPSGKCGRKKRGEGVVNDDDERDDIVENVTSGEETDGARRLEVTFTGEEEAGVFWFSVCYEVL
ncbi:hypothetical protein L6452_20069 [Arctium lappa]|uniref:Uncharacterized protein n=1 Tax=Arctium lappa TaxID=4217 RepID=A0ACB9BB47_ARCLA|nr:hypothetical protein L6452_20069 [Arctium lappa]